MDAEQNSVEAVLRESLISASGGLDLDEAQAAVNDSIQAIAKQMAVLKDAKYDPTNYPAVAKAVQQTVKGLDELYRLCAFAKGHADSRPEVGAAWLAALTDEQVRQVQRWIEEAERRRQT
jgi:hypothetical protein